MGSVITPDPHPMDPYLPPLRPAPIMRVAIRHRDLEETAYLGCFLDTGADETVLAPWSPVAIENQIGYAFPVSPMLMGDIPVMAYDLSFSFDHGEHWFYPDTPVKYDAGDDTYPWEEDVLIGRDLLWQLKFCCDGPAENFSLKVPGKLSRRFRQLLSR